MGLLPQICWIKFFQFFPILRLKNPKGTLINALAVRSYLVILPYVLHVYADLRNLDLSILFIGDKLH